MDAARRRVADSQGRRREVVRSAEEERARRYGSVESARERIRWWSNMAVGGGGRRDQ